MKPVPVPARRPAAAAPPAADQIWIALPFFLFGFLHLAAALVWLACEPELLTGHFYQPRVIAFAHAVGLGFLMSLVAGASYQLLPVAFENKLRSRPLALAHLALHLPGVPLMVFGFLGWRLPLVAAGAAAVLTGLLLYACNIARTVPRRSLRHPTTAGVLAALGSLVLALAVAFWILLSKFGLVAVPDPLALLGVHTYTMLGGFFLLLLASVSYTLLPMFLLVPLTSPRRAHASVVLTASAVALLAVGLPAWPVLLPFAAVAGAGGLGCYIAENFAAIRRSPRQLDGGLRLYAFNLAFLPPVLALLLFRALQLAGGCAPPTRSLETLVFTLAVFGTLTCAILGMASKIVPFLVWQHRYAPLLGRAVVPNLSGLVLPRLLAELAHTVPFSALLLALGVAFGHATTVRAGAAFYGVSMAAFLFNQAHVLVHLWRPDIKPLPGLARAPLAHSPARP